ncbi:MAG: penicillin-binding transpeptidase domain-containing protein [Anaerolineae bacterium]|nr:penicillin-binding transpeptidase domain-containing protein [Anaerolineae bacterium]
MTLAIIRLMRALLLGFVVVAGALAYWQMIQAPQLVARADNPRLIQAERRIHRGRLLDRTGAVLAYSAPQPGPGHTDIFRRHYPQPATAHLVGYYSLRYGSSGCEAVFDPILRGRCTWLEALLHRSQRGEDVFLSADLATMRLADAELGYHVGAFIALDITSGALLTMVSHPAYDPNRLEETWKTLTADPSAPLLNRATQGIYPVGDLARWIGLAGLLSAGTTTPPDPLHTSLEELLAPLSRMGYLATAHQLGFSQRPPIALPASPGRLPRFDGRETERDLAVTPLHMARLAAAVAGDGRMPGVELRHPAAASAGERAFSERVARTLRALTPTYNGLAGWVGVALPVETGRAPLTWLVGYAPATQPCVAFALVLEDGDNRPAALSIARRVVAALLP